MSESTRFLVLKILKTSIPLMSLVLASNKRNVTKLMLVKFHHQIIQKYFLLTIPFHF